MKPFKALKSIVPVFILALLVSCEEYKYDDLGPGLFAEFHTNKGIIVSELFYEDLPLTVGNFVSLSEGSNPMVVDSLKGIPYYDQTVFHRVIPDFMIQGGDRTATGLGHPGYKFADEFIKEAKKLKYKHDGPGVLSMANSGPDSNGSQFFITHKATPWLNGRHTVFGQVKLGQNVVDSIVQNDTLQKLVIIRQGKDALRYNAAESFQRAIDSLNQKELEDMAAYEKKKEDFLSSMNYPEAVLSPKGIRIFTKVEGEGSKAKSNMPLKVHYVGYLEDGTVFDSSYKRNRPLSVTLDVDQLISGWTEGLRGLREGSEVVLFIPYYMAYGEEGRMPLIPPKANLIFDMKLVKVGK
ncbi:MAG: peptidylprolyl isomerase [Flavobacteriaceae bacterium]